MTLFHISLSVAIMALCACMLIILYRFIKGPHLVDRIIALDIISANLIAAVAIYAVITYNEAFLDVSIIISLIAFLGTMAFAYYMKRKDQNQ